MRGLIIRGEDRAIEAEDRPLVGDDSGGELPATSSLPKRRIRLVALFLCLIYQAGNFLYFVGLAATPLGVSQVVYQSATVFVFMYSTLLLRGFVTTPTKILSVLLCIVGVSLVTNASGGGPAGGGNHTANSSTVPSAPSASRSTVHQLFGVISLLVSANLWALYEVLIPLLLPDASPADLNRFIGWRGLWNFVLLWPLPVIQSWYQPSEYLFTAPDIFFSTVGLRLLGMAFLSVASSLLIAIGITVTSPLYMRIGATLNAPVSVLWDAAVRGNAQGWQSLSGLFLTVLSFVLIIFPHKTNSGSDEAESAWHAWFHVSSGPCWGSRCRRIFKS